MILIKFVKKTQFLEKEKEKGRSPSPFVHLTLDSNPRPSEERRIITKPPQKPHRIPN